MRHEGKTQLVRRVLHAVLHGPMAPGQLVRMTCTTPKCIHPEHMKLVTRQTLAQELGALGLMSGLARSAAIARTKRATQGKLTDDQVREIKTSDEAGVRMAQRLGVSQSCISSIRTHRTRREFSSPWSQLL